MSRGSLQAIPVNVTPKGAGFGSKPDGNAGGALFGTGRERHDHRRISRARGDAVAVLRRKQQRIEPLRLHHLVDAMPGREHGDPCGGPLRSARDRPRRRNSSALSRFDWPYLSVPAALVRAAFQARSSVSDFTGAASPSSRQPRGRSRASCRT